MADVTRRIGLSLGADLCWPQCFEQILTRLKLTLPHDAGRMTFETERVIIEPFDLQKPCRYDLVLDRLTHWYHPSREWIKKALLLDGLYVLNNPWSLQSMEKHTSYCAMMRLGLKVPRTWMLPPKAYEPSPDLQPTLERYARMFDLKEIADDLGYPLFLKPYSGGGWVGINHVHNDDEMQTAYDGSGVSLMHAQAAVQNYDLFVRCVGIGPQIRYVDYDPGAPLHDRYRVDAPTLDGDDARWLRQLTLTINSFFGWDFNSAEILRSGGEYYPIDYANACPDSQVTSLHYHFPWLLKAKLRWALFCAATERPFRHNLDWHRYFAIADSDRSYPEKVAAYAAIAETAFETARFEEFCDQHLGHLDEVAYQYFDGDEAMTVVREKVKALYPEHEIEEFTELFSSRIQLWREREGQNSVLL